MDWKQFFASVIGSLAWPLVVLVLLVLIRKQLVSLASRLEEFTLPGGARAKFERQLEKAREEAAEIPLPPPPPIGPSEPALTPAVESSDEVFLRLANEFPVAAVFLAWREVEHLLNELAPSMGIERVRDPALVIETLLRKGMITNDLANVFNSLRRARNAAVHASKSDPVRPGEAIEFRDQANVLKYALTNILKEARGEPLIPPSEWKPPIKGAS